MSDNILIITGGTGGHVLPAVNFFKYLEENNNKVFILTDYRGGRYINDLNQNKIFNIYSSHYSGNLLFKLIATIKLLFGFIQSIIIFIKNKPKNIISFGSYICYSVIMFFII